MQLNTQLDPAPARRPARGLGAGPITLAAGGVATVTAVAGAFLQITLQANGNPVAVSYTGGVAPNGYIPGSCPDPCNFIMDGKAGDITLSWNDPTAGAQSAVVHIVVPAPPPKYVANPIVGRGPIKPGLPTTLTTPGAPTPTSTGTKVAAVAGVSILTVAVVSAVAGWSITRGLDHVWDKIRGKPSKR